jgi:mevalonate kinase
MEQFYNLVNKANKYFETADHLTFVTFPVVNDNKLFLAILENIHHSVMCCMKAVIYYEHLFKRIPITADNFDVQLDIFKRICIPRYNIDRSSILLIQDLEKLTQARKKSAMEFSRRENFILASREFSLKTINLYKIKNYIKQAKSLLDKVNTIASKNDRVFRR